MLLQYLGKQETRKLRLFHLNAACFFYQKNTKHSLKYQLVRAEPPFTVKMIDWEFFVKPGVKVNGQY